MSALARFLGFIVLTMAVDLACGIVGWLIGGQDGLRYGMSVSDHLCFGFVAALIAVHGWRALKEPFIAKAETK